MALAVRLREDYDAQHLRALAKASRDANQTRRLLALAAIYEGVRAAKRSGLAASGSRRCGTGCWRSTRPAQRG